MQAIAEIIFYMIYLVDYRSKNPRQFRLFGCMAVVLGVGDAFHLVPRALALCTTGLENSTCLIE